ncbi:hypothetical protein [Lentzea flaviverrucosa]|uniref:Uncharacterized protein n=1 Tax=Lentzea flaviverrucosa TaxID=200379 RepID=A0A1H9VIV6_9PSEU|nr:hypothetical protein [Lentzea flaviverrucosa]SES21655.1 hypothetical protein SAMN05216195_110110 [Lentzea flaviverrucosa]
MQLLGHERGDHRWRQTGELLGHVDVLVDNGAAFLAESQVDDAAHGAFHAAKAGQGRYAEIMSQRCVPKASA